MPKKPTSDEPAKIVRHQVTIDPDLAAKIGMIVSAQGVKIGDWVNARLRKIVDVELEAALDSMGLSVMPKPHVPKK